MYLRRGDEILLAEKQKKIGAGKLNGVGGKLEPGETDFEAAVRETKEEIGVRPTVFKKMAEITFHNCFDDETLQKMKVHTFIATEWKGEPTSTDEMKKPVWCKINDLPYEEMLPDDRYWLPLILSGKTIRAFFKFDPDWNIVEKEITEVENFGP
jgi:8-oxo-dGTP diphosphatase